MLTSVRIAIFAMFLLSAATVVSYAVKKKEFGRGILVCVLSVSLFTALFVIRESTVVAPSKQLIGQKVSICGRVSEYPLKKERSALLILENCEINGAPTDLTVRIYTERLFSEVVSLYDQVSVKNVTLKEYGGEGEFYYHTLSNGCWLQGYSRTVEITGRYSGHSPFFLMKQLRRSIKTTLLDGMGEKQGSIAVALLIGDKSDLDTTFQNELRISGASHLFAVSGMHLSLWAGAFFLIFQNRNRVKRFSNILTSVFILFYIGLTGFSPSVCRAGIMLLTLLLGRTLRKHSDPLNALGFSALILLISNVYLAGNVSFLLSYFATAALIVVFPYFSKQREKDEHFIKKSYRIVWNAVLLSLSVLLFTVPFSAFFFGSVSLLSPLSTLILTVPIELNMILSVLCVLLSAVPFVGNVVMQVGTGLGIAIRFLTEKLSGLDFAVIATPIRKIWIWYAVLLLLLPITYFLRRKRKHVLIVLLTWVVVFLSVESVLFIRNCNRYVLYIPSAGNSTSVCLSAKTGCSATLIGTGKGYDAERKITDHFRREGIFSLNALILPRTQETENGNTSDFLSYPITGIYSAGNNPELADAEKESHEADSFSVTLSDGISYQNLNDSDFAVGVLRKDTYKIVFSFLPGGNLALCPEAQSGDVLICRGYPPDGVDLACFRQIYVLTDKTAAELRLPTGVVSNAEVGDITIDLPD